jgi:microcompartment protein CcmK/EutM
MMPPTARAHTPGPEPVKASVAGLVDGLVEAPPLDDVPALACVALALLPPEPEPELGVGAGTNEIGTVTCGSVVDESPKARTHESPAAIWAVVGGQG